MNATIEKVGNVLRSEYFAKYPHEAAQVLDTLPLETTLNYLKEIPIHQARLIFFQLNSDTTAELLTEMDDKFFRELYTQVNTHLGARLLSRLSSNEIEEKLTVLPDIVSREIKSFLLHKPDTAGYMMDPTVIALFADNTVEDVLRKIRRLGDRTITVVFVVEPNGKLLGKIPIPYIAISQPGQSLGELMEPAPFISATASQEEVVDLIEKENLVQIPVTDIHQKLLGIIRNDTLMNASKNEITEDLQAMFGAGREEQALSKVSVAIKSRLPWLQVNLATAFLASMVVGFFEETIAQITILAIFLPIVAGQSGNTGSQALAVTMRGLALKEIRISQWFRVARKEMTVGFINGIAVALTTGIIVYFWASSLGIAIVIGISMVLSMVIAGLAGAIIPMGLKAIGQDPATSSSILLTTVTDICGFLSFLGLATLLSSALGIV